MDELDKGRAKWVEATRQRVIDWAGTWDEDEVPDIQLRADLAAFEEAVRAEERAARDSLEAVVEAARVWAARRDEWYNAPTEMQDVLESGYERAIEGLERALKEAK